MSGRKEKLSSENGFEEWGGYMSAKRAKLNAQFNECAENGVQSNIFAGVSIHINGHVNPTNLRAIFLQHGGIYEQHPTSSTDFVIASNMSEATKRRWGTKALRAEWVVQSVAAGSMLDHKKFLLYDYNEEQKQKTLTQAFQPMTEPVSKTSDLSSSPTKIKTNSMKPSIDERHVPIQNQKEVSPNKTNKRLMAWEDGFIEEFWDHSRLHNISTMKRLLQQYIGKLRRNRDTHQFTELNQYEKEIRSMSQNQNLEFPSRESVLFLIDLDCFFVSVGRLTRPHMQNRPVAVTHSTGEKTVPSNSDIACASYEARKFGVHNGMWVSEARKLCPDIEVIPYDFEAYKRVSDQFCDVVANLTLDIEPGSCDELLVDVTSVLKSISGSSPQSLADYLRRRIFEETKCRASIGVGKNRLLAKMASKRAKPDGVYIINADNLEECLKNRPLHEIPGIGASMVDKLISQYPYVKTCEDLQKVKLDDLRNLFGSKKGEMMHNACRGIEDSKLIFDYERPKSISIDINYGIRLQERDQLEKLLHNMAKALSKRAEEAEAYGSKVQLTVLTQQKGAPEPKKSGGHGYVDVHYKSGALMNPTRDFSILYKSFLSLIKHITVPVDKFRGIGVHLQGLKFDFDGNKRGVQQTLFNSMKKVQQRTDRDKEGNQNISDNNKLSSSNNNNSAMDVDADISAPCNNIMSVPEENYNDNFMIHADSDSSSIKIDLSVLAALPDDIASEVREFFSIRTPNTASVVALKQLTNCSNIHSHEEEPVASTSRAAMLLQHHNAERETTIDNKRKDACLKYPQVKNPFENISQLNESFMDALPEEIREEVEADFMKVKATNRNANPSVRLLSPKKNIRVLSSPPKKNINPKEKEAILLSTKSTITSGVGGRVNQLNSNANATDQRQSSRQALDEVSAKEDEREAHRAVRLLPNEKSEEVPFNRINWWKYADKDKLPTESNSEGFTTVVCPGVTKLISLPALNDKTDVAQVRNIIREGIHTLPNPTSSDLKGLTDYFNQLISGHFLKHTQLLLKFLSRLSEEPEVNRKWSKICKSIIYISQNKIKKIFGFPIQMNDIEDEELF